MSDSDKPKREVYHDGTGVLRYTDPEKKKRRLEEVRERQKRGIPKK